MTSDGQYITLNIEPSINTDDTSYKAEGSYINSDKIRNDGGRIVSQNGWQERVLSEPVTGVAREILTWKELRNMPHYALGTHNRLTIEELGTLYDITPVTTSASLSNALTVSAGSTVVKVSAGSHGRSVGDFIYVVDVSASDVGGLDLTGNTYVITSVPDTAHFWFDASATAAATSAAAGGATVIHYLLESGLQNNETAYGFGAGFYGGAQAYGQSDTSGDGLTLNLRQWALDTWGEDLIANPRNGGIYYWDATNSVTTRSSALANAPVSNGVVFAHPSRHVVALGTVPVGAAEADPLEIRWSDRDDPREWGISAGTRAGSFRIQGTGNEIMGYARTKRETLIFTDSAVWSMAPLNNELVFSFSPLTQNTGLISQHAVASIDDIVYWMGNNNFYMYDGQTRIIPNNVRDFVFDNLDADQKEKIYAGINNDYTEIFWFYQSLASTNDIDRYVKYNYKENSWDIGTFDRTVWADQGIFDAPIAVSPDGKVYNHETGLTADGSAINSFIETAYFDIGDGTQMMLLDQVVPDFVLSGSLNMTVTTQKWPNGSTTEKGPFSITANTDKINLRARGRQAKIKFSTSAAGTQWGIGKPRYRIKPDGER